MSKQLLFVAMLSFLATLSLPGVVDAYGAAHVGYTHVGPNGVYHTGETAVSGPRGTYETGHTTAAGYGGEYRSGYGYGTTAGGAHYGYGGAAVTHAPVYAPSYYGGYGYIR